jgi:hypothetical protein
MIVAASILAVGIAEAHASCQSLVDCSCPCDAVLGDSVTVTPTIGGAHGYEYPRSGIAMERPKSDNGQSYFTTDVVGGLPMRDGRPFRLYD